MSGSQTVSVSKTTSYTMTVKGLGGETTCNVLITVAPPPPAPTCTLAASPTSVTTGSSSTLSWTTTNAASFTIDQGVGSVTPVSSGTHLVSLTATTTYTGIAIGPGGSVHCTATVTITKPPPAPATGCIDVLKETFDSNGNKITPVAQFTFVLDGGASTQNDANGNAQFQSVSPGAHQVTEVDPGSSWKLLSVTPAGGNVTVQSGSMCTTVVFKNQSVNLPPPPPAPTCTLAASPTSVTTGNSSTLSWTTTNATSFTINNGIGTTTPVVSGSTTTPAITTNTTFTGTAVSSSGQSVTCSAAVSTQGGSGGGPSCSLAVSPTSYTTGGSSVLSWGGNEILNVDIDNGIATATSSPGSITISPTTIGTHTYTGTFHAQNGQTLTCNATLTVTSSGGGCTGNCGGGGGSLPPTITLAELPHVRAQPLAYLYLSQIPYTGLDLGPLGTALYWIILIGWALALAYLVLFGIAPLINRYVKGFSLRVLSVLNARESMLAEVPPVSVVTTEPVPSLALHNSTLPEAPRGYSSYEGFKSLAQNNEALSIDDIVKGLSRRHSTEPVEQKVESKPNIEPIFKNVEPITTETITERDAVPSDVRGFATALIEGDRAAVFSVLRQHIRGAGSPEQLLSAVVCLIDDAYRSRIDGTACDSNIVRLTARFSTTTLERLVAALATAIDASYTTGVTGAKLALTRALAVIGA